MSMSTWDSFPKPFAQVVRRFLADRPEHLGDGSVLAVVPLREVRRRYNNLLQIEVQFSDRKWRGYIKIRKPRPDTDYSSPAGRMQREFDLLSELHTVFGNHPHTRTVRPVAYYPECLAMITEEAPGRDMLSELLPQIGFLPHRSAVQDMESACRLCGQWLSEFQAVTVAEREKVFSLDEMREYVDQRLVTIVKRRLSGFDESMRQRALHFFDSLAELVPLRDLTVSSIHADFTTANILISKDQITIIDFEMSEQGSVIHDVVAFWHKLHLLAIDPRYSSRKAMRACQAFLDGYDPHLSVTNPLFQLFLLKTVLCSVVRRTDRKKRATIQSRLLDSYLARHGLRWLMRASKQH